MTRTEVMKTIAEQLKVPVVEVTDGRKITWEDDISNEAMDKRVLKLIADMIQERGND